MKRSYRFLGLIMTAILIFVCIPWEAYAGGSSGAINQAKVQNLASKINCSGTPIGVYDYDALSRSVSLNKTATLSKLAAKPGEVCLIGKDKNVIPQEYYDLELSGDTGRPGTLTLTFTGIEEKGTSGKLVRKIKVVPRPLVKEEIQYGFAEGTDPDNVPYSKTGARPALDIQCTISGNGAQPVVLKLVEGSDYSVTYSNNKKVGAKAVVSVKGKGSFKGKLNKILYFTVGKAPLDNGAITTASQDKKYKNKAGYFRSVPVMYDNGKKLKYGRDYKYAEGGEPRYTFVKSVELDEIAYSAGDAIPDGAVLPANTDICVSFNAVPVQNGNYCLGADQEAVLCKAYYRIGQTPISRAKVVIEDQLFRGEGKNVTPGKSAVKSISIRGTGLTYEDFEIVSFSANDKPGKAVMMIHGIGNYYGTKKCSFKIVKAKADGAVQIDSAADLEEKVEVIKDEESGEITNEETSLGSIDDNGFVFTVGEGALKEDAKFSFASLSREQLESIGAIDQTAERIISPMSIECDAYDGAVFADGEMMLTLPITDTEDPAAFVFCCYDERLGEIRYLYPESYDLEKGTMSVSLPHFSWWWNKKMTKEEQIEAFLDRYSNKLAMEKGNYKQAAAVMEPYMKQKIAALGLTKKAAADLLQFSMVRWAASFDGDAKGSGFFEQDAKVVTAMTRAIYENDQDAILQCLGDSANEAVKKSWELMEYSQRISEKIDSKIFDGTGGAVIGSSNALSRMAAYFIEGGEDNYKAGMEELGNILQGVDPVVEKVTKITAFVGSCVNLGFTYWKADKIEELYQIYKNGLDSKWFGNYVIAGDRESFTEYINYASGLTMSKGIARFYNMDKMSERIVELGWDVRYGTKDYTELPLNAQNTLSRYAIDSLLNYFDTRLAQEKDAAKIKEVERETIETMLSFGALDPRMYNNFFGEYSADDYDLNARLERLCRVRSMISMYVDEPALERLRKAQSYNYGDVLNYWVMYISDKNETRESAIEKFKATLYEWGVLNKNFVVRKTVDGIDLNYSRISLKTGDTAVLKAKISPDDAYDKTVIWSVDETKALELIPGGTEGSASLSCKIKAHDGARRAVVTATTRDGEYTVSCVVKIKIPGQDDALELDIESNEIWLGVGETYTFNVLEGDLGEVTSSNPQVAKVDGRTITALDYGEADITIKDANYKDNEYVIHVYVPVPDDHLYFGIYESWLSRVYTINHSGENIEDYFKDDAELSYSSVYITYKSGSDEEDLGEFEYPGSIQINTRLKNGSYFSRIYKAKDGAFGETGGIDRKLYLWREDILYDDDGVPVYDEEGNPVMVEYFDGNNYIIAPTGIHPGSFILYSVEGSLDDDHSDPMNIYREVQYTFDLTEYTSIPVIEE